ncbi:hypothetical protein SH668x_002874 [Planctomicrobium sp. SH668]|uniref:hypothetical protein n=1 Tax=Planctomicrobium sp. SH668 TaxID=3448126 RepID=UPI003F5C1594
MRKFCAVLCTVAIFAGSSSAFANPTKAPAASVPADPLVQLVDQAINVTRQRNLDFQVHTPWQILHGLLALRTNYTIKNGPEYVNALDYLSTKATFKGERWFERTSAGAKARPYNGTPYDFEGHINQTLSIIAMCDLPLTHQFVLADGSKVTMADMVRQAQYSVNDKEETTWTLWFLTHYLDQDTHWKNGEGEAWSMEKLVRIQTAAPVINSACGGCHNLFALAYARNAYLQKHGRLQGSWLEADQKIQQHISAAQSMMNRDGSFSTQFFKARGMSNDFNERIKSSGHMLEWLMVALPRKRLNENWVRLGVQTLANDMIKNASQPADCGPLYHSLHALILFKQRMQPDFSPNATRNDVANGSTTNSAVAQWTKAKPDGDSVPKTANQQPQTPSTTEQVTAKPVSVTNEPATPTAETSPVEFQSPTENGDESATNLNRSTESTQPPVLMVPPISPPEHVKPVSGENATNEVTKLSGKAEENKALTIQAEGMKLQPSSGPKSLAPFKGGMPILRQPPTAPTPSKIDAMDEKVETAAKLAQ